jgi:hypothetical protein
VHRDDDGLTGSLSGVGDDVLVLERAADGR